ncbi:hypothetical protein OCEANICA350_20024 [Oceanicaulis sp. 350]|nr:hypothetical protein OCEANICA350_20024 [Oceanicaulis sp. 350]
MFYCVSIKPCHPMTWLCSYAIVICGKDVLIFHNSEELFRSGNCNFNLVGMLKWMNAIQNIRGLYDTGMSFQYAVLSLS